MYEPKKLERHLRVNLLGPGPCLIKKEFTGLRSHKGWETLIYSNSLMYVTVKKSTCATPFHITSHCHVKYQQCLHLHSNAFSLGWSKQQSPVKYVVSIYYR